MDGSKQKAWFYKKLQLSNSKKIDAIKALWIPKTIYDRHFFVKINQIWENWINRQSFIPLLKLEDHFWSSTEIRLLKRNSIFEIRRRSRLSWPLYFNYSIQEFAFLLTK